MSAPAVPVAGEDLEARALALARGARRRPLDPIDRFSEIIFGLVMVLAFTGTVRVAEAGREQVRDMLVAALGCNLAWGVVDAVMFLVTSMVDRARRVAVVNGIRVARPEAARAIVLAALPEAVALVTDEAEADRMAARVRALPEPLQGGLRLDDLQGSLASGLLVLAATFPPTVPFLLWRDDVRLALTVSNAVAVASLFLAGWRLGRATGARALLLGLGMVVVGGGLVALTVALGG
jgi:hypothetical protein